MTKVAFKLMLFMAAALFTLNVNAQNEKQKSKKSHSEHSTNKNYNDTIPGKKDTTWKLMPRDTIRKDTMKRDTMNTMPPPTSLIKNSGAREMAQLLQSTIDERKYTVKARHTYTVIAHT